MKFGKQINPFIRAHGASPGPLMRPLLTGLLSGELASLGILLIFYFLHGLTHLTRQFGWMPVLLGFAIYGAFSGLAYGKIFRRAANDLRGGWIFGSSTGFILWMINPLIWLPWFGFEPIFLGKAALVFMLAHSFHGALLGFLFPRVHFLTTKRIPRLNA